MGTLNLAHSLTPIVAYSWCWYLLCHLGWHIGLAIDRSCVRLLAVSLLGSCPGRLVHKHLPCTFEFYIIQHYRNWINFKKLPTASPSCHGWIHNLHNYTCKLALERRVAQHTFTHASLINESSAALTNFPHPCGLMHWASLWGRPQHWHVKGGMRHCR